jgi:hypothetical protein
MKETFYFSHDYNARTDAKIKNLIRKHGFLGYGIFWAIIEDLYNNANALQTDCEGIAFDLHSDHELIRSIIFDFDLFVFDGDTFGSLSVQRRLEERDKKSNKARESAFKRWSKDANAMRTHSEGNAIKERKGKDIKESKDKKAVFTKPTQTEVESYFTENGYTKESGQKAFTYYDIADWKDSQGKQVRNWKQKMQSVWFKPENKAVQNAFDWK